jgi:hypothetical protein
MPVDRSAIDAQLREIGEGERWWEQREFRELPYILHPDERIKGICNGKLLGARRPRLFPSAPWLILVTTERLICLRQERFGRKQIEIPTGQITGIRQQGRFRSHQITIQTPQRRYRLRIAQDDAFRFVGALASLMPSAPPPPLDSHAGALGWIPGMNTVATLPGFSGIISRVAMLSPPDYATRSQVATLEVALAGLQEEVDRLQQQVQFLENLMQRRADEALRSGAGVDS